MQVERRRNTNPREQRVQHQQGEPCWLMGRVVAVIVDRTMEYSQYCVCEDVVDSLHHKWSDWGQESQLNCTARSCPAVTDAHVLPHRNTLALRKHGLASDVAKV